MRARHLSVFLALPLWAQTPAFEVASVKASQSVDASNSIRSSPGQISFENVSLRKLILIAHGIPDERDFALESPSWLATTRFYIVGKHPADASREQIMLMLRTLLADRFKLALHTEKRQMSGYALVVAKNGAKLQAAEPGRSQISGRPGRFEMTKIGMQKFADTLARMTGRPIADETGLSGVFNFTLDFTPDESHRLGPPGEAPPVVTTGAPSLLIALQEQLGLKLEGRKVPVDVMVVDRIERTPTEN